MLNNITTTNSKQQGQKPNISTLSDKFNEDLSEKIDKFTKLYYQNPKDIEVGKTPHEIVKETHLYRLLHYKPIFKKPLKTPILIVYALINKSYIFDLQDDKSWIKNLLYQGY